MKLFLLLGGVCGFTLAFASSLYAGKDLTIVIRDSAFWCLIGAFVMKLCYKLLARFLKDAASARQRAAEAAEAAEAAGNATGQAAGKAGGRPVVAGAGAPRATAPQGIAKSAGVRK